MIRIVTIGMNHRTAPVELRECLAQDSENVPRALAAMREDPAVREGMFLSTCNRVEALYTTQDPEAARRGIHSILTALSGLPEQEIQAGLYEMEGMECVHHVFNVASSLDSMIVGEPQILGQFKEAYGRATQERMSGVILNRLIHRAFHVAKRVRTETGISDAAVSISYAAVELARKIFHDLSGRKVLLIGAGEMAELAARHLLGNGVSHIAVANRTFSRAVQVAEAFRGTALSFEEIDAELLEADIVITSTASAGYVITRDQVKQSLRKRRNRPLFFIDIAVPRDVDPRVNNLGNTYVYDIDDLKGVVEINRAQREQEAIKAERIIQEEVLRFERWLKTLRVVPTIVDLKEKVESIRRAEIQRSLAALGPLSREQMHAIDVLTASIAEKIIHDPILTLKRKAERPTRDQVLDMTRQLFHLDEPESASSGACAGARTGEKPGTGDDETSVPPPLEDAGGRRKSEPHG